MNRLIILGVVVIAVIYVLISSSIFVVNEREQAIVLRFGQITDVKTEPGIYFKLPTTIVDIGPDHRGPPAALRHGQHDACRCRGGKFYEVDAFAHLPRSPIRALFRQRCLGQISASPRTRLRTLLRCGACAGSTVCAASTPPFRKSVRR